MFVLSGKEAKESYQKAFKSVAAEFYEANSYMDKIRETGGEQLKLFGIKETDMKDIDTFIDAVQVKVMELSEQKINAELELKGMSDLDEIAKKEKEIQEIETDRVSISHVLEESYKAQTTSLTKMKAMSEKVNQAVIGNLDPQLKMNSLVESRLDSERALMESANFGMGASVIR
jgi:predicted  nucleic acid-binding Zn-ribbon protein